MPNRIVGNVMIVDSAMANLLIIEGSTGNFSNYRVSSVAFWSASTLGDFALTSINTTNVLVRFSYLTHASGGAGFNSIIQATQYISIGAGVNLGDLKAPIVTAGTAFLYLG